MRCLICDATDKWENVDAYRLAPKGMHICNGCGFVSYPEKYKTEDEIKKYYEKDYRKPPTVSNAFTGQKKLHIHAAFLDELLKGWKKENFESPVIFEIGAAYGVFLNWLRGLFPKADISGTEYALAYRRNAWHEYKINLGLDFDKSKKYDLITSFKVAEHQMDVDLRLRECVECLSKHGHIYISVPTWFGTLNNFGAEGYDLEYYYHPDHINVWTKKLFETLLKKVGLKIVKHDGVMYDDTYLCQRDDSLMNEPPEYEDPKAIKETMGKIFEASKFYMDHQFDEAISSYPNFPSAWINRYEKNRAEAHKNSERDPIEYMWNKYVMPAIEACPTSLEVFRLAVDVNMRYERFKEAISWINKALELRPNGAVFLLAMCHCLREIAMAADDEAARAAMFKEARECARYLSQTDLQSKNNAITMIYQDNANIPTPYE